MSLLPIFEVPQEPDEFAVWSFAHAAHHKDINRVVFETNSLILPDYILDPFDPNDMISWLYHHQTMHNAQNAVLGIAGFNLSELDWRDAAGWVWNHAQEHYQAGTILELG